MGSGALLGTIGSAFYLTPKAKERSATRQQIHEQQEREFQIFLEKNEKWKEQIGFTDDLGIYDRKTNG